MKKKLSKFFMIMVAICLLLITISTTGVQAATQSNPNTHYKKAYTPEEWMLLFRNMETTGEALGLSEKINETTMLATSGTNNLDSHMMKSTEYGAIAILSASGYGNPKTLQESTIKTTTGNETGVYFDTSNHHWVAAGLEGKIFLEVDARYYDAYGEDNTSAKIGDALGTADTTNPGCTRWHSAYSWSWVTTPYNIYFSRGLGGMFSFYQHYAYSFSASGVIVCGEGL